MASSGMFTGNKAVVSFKRHHEACESQNRENTHRVNAGRHRQVAEEMKCWAKKSSVNPIRLRKCKYL